MRYNIHYYFKSSIRWLTRIFIINLIILIAIFAQETLVSDDFDSYPVGDYPPPSSGWEAHYNAVNDPSNNIVTDTTSYSSPNSLQVYGSHSGCWGAAFSYEVSFPEIFYLEIAMQASGDIFSSSSCHDWDIGVGMAKEYGPSGVGWLNLAVFRDDGNIKGASGEVIQTYNTNTWYKVKMKIDISESRVDYWIDGVYKGYQTNSSLQTESYFHLHISSGGGKGWVDDVNMWTTNNPPTADSNGPYSCNVGDTINLDGSGSTDSDGTITKYEWDLDNDSQYDDATGVNPSYTCTSSGTHSISLKVTDDDGATDTDSTNITVGESKGDINSDGVINVFDSRLVLQYTQGLITLTDTQKQAADVAPPCGTIDINDATLIAQVAIGMKNANAFNC